MKEVTVKLGLVAALVMTLGCKKTKLSDENMILKGKWKWVYSDYTLTQYPSGAISNAYTIHSSGYPHQYSIEIRQDGHIIFSTDEKSDKYRFVLENFGKQPNGNFYHGIFVLKNGKDRDMVFQLIDEATDTLQMENFPFESSHTSTEGTDYNNYFIRE